MVFTQDNTLFCFIFVTLMDKVVVHANVVLRLKLLGATWSLLLVLAVSFRPKGDTGRPGEPRVEGEWECSLVKPLLLCGDVCLLYLQKDR